MRGPMAHLDPEVLAEFDAGLITGRRADQISAHLAACEQCTAVGEQLAGVSALLMAASAATMPDPLAERLDTVLTAEIARRDQAESAGVRLAGDATQPAGAGARLNGDGPGGKGSRDRARRPRPAWRRSLRPVALRVLAPAAVVALVIAGGYTLSLGGSTSSSATSSAASPANRSAPGRPAAAESSSAASAGGGAIGANRPAAAPLKTASTAFPVVTGTVNFTPGSFKQQVEAALRVPVNERRSQTATTTIRACVQALAGGTASPVLVESARYQGQPATLVVLRTGSGDTAWVAGSRCSATDHDLLDQTTVPSGISGP